MSLTRVLAEDRRLVILRTLSEVPGYRLNEDVIRQAVTAIGHSEASKDFIRQDLRFLEEHDLVRREDMALPSGTLWIITLTTAGGEVARGRHHEGVAHLQPGS